MRLTANRQKLLEAFTVAGSVVAPRSIKPILQNLRFTVEGGGATLLATDLEVSIRYQAELDGVQEGGDVLLPAAKVLSILRESDSEEVEITSNGNVVEFHCGNGRFKVLGEDPEEYPEIPSFEDEQAFSVSREAFRTLVKKTSFAAARERTRYAFNGVRCEIEGDTLRMIATDGKRMAVKSVPVENPDGLELGKIIPTKGLQAFERVLAEEDEQMRISLRDKQAMVKTSRAEVSSRLVEGAFPHYKAVIPQETPQRATFNLGVLQSALRRSAILTNEESRSVRLAFDEGLLTITSRAIDVGESRVEIEADYAGEPVSLAFNPDFLVDGLKAMDGETVHINLAGPDTPARLDGEENYVYVVMPVTLRTA